MKEPDDFPLQDTTRNYCKYCAREDGTMQSYSEKLESMTHFIVRTQGLDQKVAKESAEFMLKQLPAWKNHDI